MKCPYCLSEIDQEAFVCKVCTRDVYLFKPLMAKVDALESQLAAIPSQEAYTQRIAELESALSERANEQLPSKSRLSGVLDVIAYIGIPLVLLLVAHVLITIVYDTKMLYLRIISILLPLPFGYFLFKGGSRRIFPWFIGVILLAMMSVIGMSYMTSLVDGSPIWPQNLFEWKEVLEYSTSIAFSFLTGMLLGGVAYLAKQRKTQQLLKNSLVKALVKDLAGGELSPKNIGTLIKKLEEYGGMVIAVGTTIISAYTGLKGMFGN